MTGALRSVASADRVADLERGEPALLDGARITRLLREGFRGSSGEPAVADDRESVDYRALAERAERLAASLRRRGVGPDSVVAVCAERSVGLAVAVVAILLADGAYLPIDPGWPASRVAHIFAEAQPVLVLCDDPVLRGETVPEGVESWPLAGPERPAGSLDEPAARPAGGVCDLDLAYVVYTSGSTGRPKGVAVPHRALVNRLRWMQEQFPIGPGDTVLQKTPYVFDVSVWELLWPLLSGARLVMARPDGHRDPGYLADVIRRERVTVVHFVPSMLDLFLTETEPRSLPSLRHVIASGEALSADLANRFTAAQTARLHNLYGPTEAAIDVTWSTCREVESGAGVPIGRPIRGTQVTVRDEAGLATPRGELGELLLGGVCLARGYLAQPELTAASFIDDPLEPGNRLYRTGDVVRWSEEGVLEYHGRKDHQVKVRGQRIELGEIEAVAVELARVGASAAVTRESRVGGPEIVLYVTPELDADAVAEIRRHLATRLPEAHLPSAVIPLAALPLTSNGKCDRKALAAMGPQNAGRGGGRRRPRAVGGS